MNRSTLHFVVWGKTEVELRDAAQKTLREYAEAPSLWHYEIDARWDVVAEEYRGDVYAEKILNTPLERLQ